MNEFVAMPIIVVCTYILGQIYKLIFKKIESAYKYIPLVTVIAGGAMGVLIFYTSPELLVAKTVYDALIIGFVSGGSSTGANQIFKQFTTK